MPDGRRQEGTQEHEPPQRRLEPSAWAGISTASSSDPHKHPFHEGLYSRRRHYALSVVLRYMNEWGCERCV